MNPERERARGGYYGIICDVGFVIYYFMRFQYEPKTQGLI